MLLQGWSVGDLVLSVKAIRVSLNKSVLELVNRTLQMFSSSTEVTRELSRELSTTTEIPTEYLEEKQRRNLAIGARWSPSP